MSDPAPVPPAPAAASRPPRPNRLDPVETVFQTALLALRRMVRGPRAFVALAIVLLPLAVTWPIAARGEPKGQEEFLYSMLSFYHFGIAVPGVALAFATAFPFPEAEEGTLTYWFTAPVPRWTIHLGRFAAAWLAGTVALPLSVVAIAAPLSLPEAADLRGVAVTAISSTLLAYPAYLALFWLAATVTRRGLAIGVIFVLVEGFTALVQSNVALITVINYVRSLVRPAVPGASRAAAKALIGVGDAVEPATAAIVLAMAAVVPLVLSLLLVEWIEYRGKTSQAS